MAMKYALQSSEYNDSDLIEARKTQLQQVQAMYDYGRNQEIAKMAEQKAKAKHTNELYDSFCLCRVVLVPFLYL